jgi:PAS domain S-box-containing protein
LLPSGKFPRLALFAAFAAVVLLVGDLEFVRNPGTRLLFSNTLGTVTVALASFCSCYVALRCRGYARQVWLLLGVALGVESVGQAITTYYQSFVPGSALSAQPSDLFFFVWAAPIFMILLPNSEEPSPKFDSLRLLDFLQIALVAVTVYLYFFYFSSAWKSDHYSLLRGILLLYIGRDLLLACAFLLRARSTPAPPPWFRLFCRVLAAAFFLSMASDSEYLLNLTGSISTATWGDLLWMAPALLVAGLAAFWNYDAAALPPPSPTRAASFFNTQLFPVLMPLLVIFMARAIAGEHAVLAWIFVAVSVLCSSIRLIFTNQRQLRISADLLSAEKALLRSEQLLSSAFRASPDGFAINIFPDGSYIDVNDGFTRLTGYTRDEAVHRTPTELNLWLHPERRAEVLSQLTKAGEVHDVEFDFRTKDGRLRTGMMSGSLLNLDGRQCALVAVRDITERKAADELVRTNEQRFRSLVDNLHVCINSFDPQGRMTFANRASLDLLGMTLDQVIGKTPQQLGLVAVREDGTLVPDSERIVPKVIATGQAVRSESYGWRVPGRTGIVWTLLDAIPEYNSAGEMIRIVASFSDVSDQRRAIGAMRESEERFRSFVENLHVGIVSCDAQAHIHYANPAALEMFEMKMEQVSGKTEVELGLQVLREDGSLLPASEGLVPTVVAMRRPIHSHVAGWRHMESGKVIWTLLDAVPQCNAEGEVTNILVSLTNLTEQRRATEALRESEERFRTLVTNLHSAVVLHDLEGRVEYANPALLRMFGYSSDSEVVGKRASELGVVTLTMDGREMSGDERPISKVLRTHSPVRDAQVGFRRPRSNEPLWVFGSSIPRFDAGGKMIGVITSFMDVTEQRRATEALRESEERFRTLVRDLHVGVVLHNPDASVQFANRAALETLGITAEEVAGKMPSDLGLAAIDVNGDPIDSEDLPSRKVIRTKLPAFNQVLGWRRPGAAELTWIFGNAVPQFAPDGSILRVISSFSDITEMKNAERAIHQLSKELLKLQDDERRRIGRELHDGMAQTVLAINLSLAQIRQSAQPLNEASSRALDKARELLQQMSREIRTLSYLLHPPLLDDLGLVTALKEYVNGFSERSGIETSLSVPSRFRRLPQIVETAFFRITQESLSNIQRHSGSKVAKVTLGENEDSVTLQITDYGRGIGAPANGEERRHPARLGVGIPGMRERMAQLGGYLDIESNSRGTTVRARISLSAPALKETVHDESATAYRG